MRFGLTGKLLKWIKSCLLSRQWVVNINGTNSDSRTMRWGVPQGSVLGPLLFILYISPIEDIIHSHSLNVLLYADDTQIYVSLKPSSKEDIKIRFEVCLSDLRTWFVANKLCCNSSKTNFIYFTPLSRLSSPSLSIQFGSST